MKTIQMRNLKSTHTNASAVAVVTGNAQFIFRIQMDHVMGHQIPRICPSTTSGQLHGNIIDKYCSEWFDTVGVTTLSNGGENIIINNYRCGFSRVIDIERPDSEDENVERCTISITDFKTGTVYWEYDFRYFKDSNMMVINERNIKKNEIVKITTIFYDTNGNMFKVEKARVA